MLHSRSIRFVDSEEDTLQEEVNTALQSTMKECLQIYCQVVATNFALAGINVDNYQMERTIQYVD